VSCGYAAMHREDDLRSTVLEEGSFQPKKFTNNSNFLLSVLPFPSLSADGTMWTPSTKSENGKSTCMKRKRSTKKIKKDAVNRDSEVCNYWLPCSRVLERKRALPEMRLMVCPTSTVLYTDYGVALTVFLFTCYAAIEFDVYNI
jgi:hypothetical protein